MKLDRDLGDIPESLVRGRVEHGNFLTLDIDLEQIHLRNPGPREQVIKGDQFYCDCVVIGCRLVGDNPGCKVIPIDSKLGLPPSATDRRIDGDKIWSLGEVPE